MNAAAEPESAHDLLRVSNCPQCDYSLTGLPGEGVCPECGWAYDRGAVILRCKGPGAFRLHSYVLALGGLLCGGVVIMALIRWPAGLRHATQMLVMFCGVAALCAITLLERATSPRVGDWLLWITPSGIGVQREFDPDSLLARIRRGLTALFLPVYLMTGFLPMVFELRRWYIGTGIMLVYGVGVSILVRMLEVRPTIPSRGAQPAMFTWEHVNRVAIDDRRRGKLRLRAWRSSWISKKQLLIDVLFDCADERLAQIRQRLAIWYGKEITQNAK